MTKEFSRRDFMATAGKLLAMGSLIPLGDLVLPKGAAAEQAVPVKSWPETWNGKEWCFVVDTPKCIGCGRCVKACKEENGVPMDKEVYRTCVERYLEDANGKVKIDSPDGGQAFTPTPGNYDKQFFVPKLCNQCKKPVCVQECPVGASYRTGDGVVLVDRQRCIGCGYCVQACPYGVRYIHPVLHVADKCTWCYHRLVKGMLPACVEVCPMGVRKIGNSKDPAGEVPKIIKEKPVRLLKPDMGTQPNVYYVSLDEVVE